VILVGDRGKLHRAKKADINVGISSRITARRHIILLDLDRMSIHELRNRVRRIKNMYRLAHFYVLKSSRGHYHAVCFQLVPFSMLLRIMKQLGDRRHYGYTKMRAHATLRISRKSAKKSSRIRFIQKIKGTDRENVKLKNQYFSLLGFEHGA